MTYRCPCLSQMQLDPECPDHGAAYARTQPTATDFLGNTYTIGDHVTYATTSGRSPVMKYARVEKITRGEDTAHVMKSSGYLADDGRRWVPPVYENKVTPWLKVGVREISNARGFTRWDTLNYDYETHTRGPDKPARITYPMPENIVKVVSP